MQALGDGGYNTCRLNNMRQCLLLPAARKPAANLCLALLHCCIVALVVVYLAYSVPWMSTRTPFVGEQYLGPDPCSLGLWLAVVVLIVWANCMWALLSAS
jgi:hypothetical protein